MILTSEGQSGVEIPDSFQQYVQALKGLVMSYRI